VALSANTHPVAPAELTEQSSSTTHLTPVPASRDSEGSGVERDYGN
jgi:hypothetical protein